MMANLGYLSNYLTLIANLSDCSNGIFNLVYRVGIIHQAWLLICKIINYYKYYNSLFVVG